MATRKRLQVRILDQRIGKEIPMPSYATRASAGMDLRACLDAPLEIKPGETHLIKTGISVFVADPNYAAFLFARSGLSHKHSIGLTNAVGVVDADYQGEVMVSLCNRGSAAYTVQIGERIAQMVLMPVTQADFDIVETFEATERGEGGFGSTGRTQ